MLKVALPQDTVFSCSVKKKLEMLGKHGAKILVGGAAPDQNQEEDAEPAMLQEPKAGHKPRGNADIEPFMLHAPPFAMYEEIIHAFGAKGVISLAGDGRAALACLERRLPYCGLTFSPRHTEALQAHLESKVFERFCNCKSRLHEPALAALLDRNVEADKNGAGQTDPNTQGAVGTVPPKTKGKEGNRGRGRGQRGRGRLGVGGKKRATKKAPGAEGGGEAASSAGGGEGAGDEDTGAVPPSGEDLLAHVKKLAAAACAP